MDLGVNIGYWGLGLTSDQQLELVKAAEAADYSVVWAAEAYGSDAASVLGWLAASTTRIGIGSAIFQIPGRSAAMTAMTTATLDQLSEGRFRLGLGVSGPQVSEGWHGVRFAKQLTRTREYVDVVRMALARERVEYHGESIDLPLPDGPGKALKLTIATHQDRVPIYLAAIGPKNVALAAEIADGWLPMLFSPEHVGEFRPMLEEGAARAGRDLSGFDIAPSVNALVTDDIDSARNIMRPFIGLYVGGMGSKDRNFYNSLVRAYGFEAEAQIVQDLYLEGRKDEACAALPSELIDLISLAGPREHVRERMRAFKDAGVTTLSVTPVTFDSAERIRQVEILSEIRAEL